MNTSNTFSLYPTQLLPAVVVLVVSVVVVNTIMP